jgi:hypothetical protein
LLPNPFRTGPHITTVHNPLQKYVFFCFHNFVDMVTKSQATESQLTDTRQLNPI